MIYFLLISLQVFAVEPNFDVKVVSKAPYSLKFTPPVGHHFNLAAPAEVNLVNGAGEPVAAELKKEEHLVVAAFTGQPSKDCKVSANLFVCNDANTYCKPVQKDFHCASLKGQ